MWKILKKKIRKKNKNKSFDKKNFGKINYKIKIFMTKIYSNIDKCYTIFALLAPFEKTGRKTVIKTSAAYDLRQAVSRARIGREDCGDLNEVGIKDVSRLASCRELATI